MPPLMRPRVRGRAEREAVELGRVGARGVQDVDAPVREEEGVDFVADLGGEEEERGGACV